MREENVFDRINDWIQNVEYSVVNLVSTIAPWLAPLAPAYLSYFHMKNLLFFPWYVAFLLSVMIEILGLSTVHTSITFWNHNRKYSADKNKVPLLIPIFSFLFYLFIVLTMNVLLEIDPEAVVLAKALLTLMTVPAAFTLGVRSILKDVQDGLKKPKDKKNRQKKEVANNQQNVAESKQEISDWRDLPHDERMKVATMSPRRIASIYKLADRTAYNWKSYAEQYAESYVYNQENE